LSPIFFPFGLSLRQYRGRPSFFSPSCHLFLVSRGRGFFFVFWWSLRPFSPALSLSRRAPFWCLCPARRRCPGAPVSLGLVACFFKCFFPISYWDSCFHPPPLAFSRGLHTSPHLEFFLRLAPFLQPLLASGPTSPPFFAPVFFIPRGPVGATIPPDLPDIEESF